MSLVKGTSAAMVTELVSCGDCAYARPEAHYISRQPASRKTDADGCGRREEGAETADRRGCKDFVFKNLLFPQTSAFFPKNRHPRSGLSYLLSLATPRQSSSSTSNTQSAIYCIKVQCGRWGSRLSRRRREMLLLYANAPALRQGSLLYLST